MKFVVKKPVITEKSINLYSNKKIATFEVCTNSNKSDIKNFISSFYKVEVKEVNVLTRLGKVKFSRASSKFYKTKPKKIAYVKISQGDIKEFLSNGNANNK